MDATWVDFDAKKGPQRLPNWVEHGAEMASKNDQEIRSVFDCLLDAVHWDSASARERAGAVGGARGRHELLPPGIWIRIY